VARAWITVFGTAAYLARAEKLLSDEEQEAVVRLIAQRNALARFVAELKRARKG
jgi:chorismate mutase